MQQFIDYLDEGAADAALRKKSEASGVSLATLKTVYKRGVAAWNSGHRPGTTPQQWGMARVNSYITKGKGTYHGADKDLREEEELEEAESWEAGYKRRVVKTTKPEHKEDGYEWRIKGKERPEISIKLYKEKPSQSEFNKQMRRVAGHEFGEEYTVEDSRADNKAYHKGVSDSTARARVAHWKKMDKLSDRDPRSYEPAPGDATAKTKESVHTKKYRKMYGEESMITFSEYLKEANTQADLPVHIHKDPYEGAEVGEYTTQFPGSPISAQEFAKHVISKGGKARIGKRGSDYNVYHNKLITKDQWRKSKTVKEQSVSEAKDLSAKISALEKKINEKQGSLEMAREKRKMSGKSKGVQSEREVKLGAEISRLSQELYILKNSQKDLVEAVKGWKHAGRDLMKSRQEKSDAAREVRLVSLKKDGTESKMHDAEKRFGSEDEARQHHEKIKKLNPNRAIMHNLYVGDKVEKLS